MKSYSAAELEALVKRIAGKVIHLEPEKIDFNSNLREDLGMDSIDLFDILGLLSQELNTNLYPEEFKTVNTVSDFLDCLKSILENPRSGQNA